MNRWISRRLPALALFSALLLAAAPNRSKAAGEVYWFSLLTENVYVAMDFYTDLFGWQIASSPTGAFMAIRNGIPIAGLSQIEDRIPDTSESMWLAAITVADLPASMAIARELGATVHENETRVEGWGSYALIQDPQGAPASLVVTERPLGGTEGYSGWAWAELWTQDTDAANRFYSQVIGYELDEVQVGEQAYSVFSTGENRHAGLVELENPEIAPRWAPYVGVSDLRGILVRVWELGGEVLLEPAEIESEIGGHERVALIADPTGAALFLYQLEEQATADPEVQTRQSAGSPRRVNPGNSGSSGSGPDVSVHFSYGFGYGWGGAWPRYPYRPIGPPIY